MRASVGICALILAAGALPGQHSYTPNEIEDGGRLYRMNCATCHGPDGDQVAGVDLGHGKFRQASSDEDLIKVIQNGISGTKMPPSKLSDTQAGTVVAYMRSMSSSGVRTAAASGDAARGKALFEGKAGCANCHRVRGNGSRFGPDLTEIGTVRRAVELERSILEPDAEVAASNRGFRVVTRDGTAITGRLLNVDTFTVQLIDTKGQLRSFQKSDLKEYAFLDKSPMPSYQGKLTPQELADVIGYLVSLKGIDQP